MKTNPDPVIWTHSPDVTKLLDIINLSWYTKMWDLIKRECKVQPSNNAMPQSVVATATTAAVAQFEILLHNSPLLYHRQSFVQ